MTWLHHWLAPHLEHDYTKQKQKLTIEYKYIHRTNTWWKQHSFVVFLESYKQKIKTKVKGFGFQTYIDYCYDTQCSGRIINQKKNKCCLQTNQQNIIIMCYNPNLFDIQSEILAITNPANTCNSMPKQNTCINLWSIDTDTTTRHYTDILTPVIIEEKVTNNHTWTEPRMYNAE
jgi:hypothetical protein